MFLFPTIHQNPTSDPKGGFAAYACPESGLSLCVMKTVYEPLVAIGGSISPDVCEIAATVREELEL